MLVRPLEPEDIEAVVARVASSLSSDAARNPLINPVFSHQDFALALAAVRDQTWVAVDERAVTGHLYGAILENAEHGRGAWIGPDGVSFDDAETLVVLYREAETAWTARRALEHYVWVRDDEDVVRPWHELGFARSQSRGVIELATFDQTSWPEGYEVRRGDLADLDVALALDRVLDDAEGRGASFESFGASQNLHEEWRALLTDHDVHHYLVEFAGDVVAQCVTYPLPSQRGTFEHTLHVSAVVVRPAHEHRGVARALLGTALNDARDVGFRYAETSWRVTNGRAADFWRRYGFRPTYVRLRRTVDVI